MIFQCDKCGECCRNLDKSDIYKELHEGNGICRYLQGNICSIYEKRPLLCQVDNSYEKIFKNEISKEEYYGLNYKFCAEFKIKILLKGI